jgi:hypothetical protein
LAIQQFYIQLGFERKSLGSDGREHRYLQTRTVDLVHEDIAAFLASIPDDIDRHSNIIVAIRRADGEVVPYADGMDYDQNTDGTRGPMRDIAMFEGGEADYEHTATLFADRAFRPQG